MTVETKFFADAMLGRLALWLRAAGFDVAYEAGIEDNDLINRAREEGRVILTRDTLLVKRRLARDNSFFIKSDNYKDQLSEVMAHYKPPGDGFLTRCLKCNEPLIGVRKEEVKGSVPPYVFDNHERFSKCPCCGRIYWAGTHVSKMKRRLDNFGG